MESELRESLRISFSREKYYFPQSNILSNKMWYLIDPDTGLSIGKIFETKTALAEFLGTTPSTLGRKLKAGQFMFRLGSKEVQVAERGESRFEVLDSEGKVIARAKNKNNLAEILGVSRQAVSKAYADSGFRPFKIRGNEIRQIFDKEKEYSLPTFPAAEQGSNREKAVLVNKKYYSSITEAAKELKVDRKTISFAVNHKGVFKRQRDGKEFFVEFAPAPSSIDFTLDPEERKEREYFRKTLSPSLRKRSFARKKKPPSPPAAKKPPSPPAAKKPPAAAEIPLEEAIQRMNEAMESLGIEKEEEVVQTPVGKFIRFLKRKKLIGGRTLPQKEDEILQLKGWVERTIADKNPGWAIRSYENEKGEKGDKLFLQIFRKEGYYGEIKTYDDFVISFDNWGQEGKEKYVMIPSKNIFDKNVEAGQWYFRVGFQGSKKLRLCRVMRWKKI